MTTSAAPSPAAATPSQLVYADIPHELRTTRRLLERVPADRADWVPHGKSMPLGRLAAHLAELPQFAVAILTSDELDFNKGAYVPVPFESTAQVLAVFDERAAKMQAVIDGADWDALAKRWTLRAGDHVILEGVKGTLLRTLGMSHIVHHRAQLGVYLRLLDVAVPGTYGPSADEQ
ncbi:MAG: DinB family protein [Gemmatirosa sp.]